MPLPVGLPNFEDQKLLLEVKFLLICGYIINFIKLLILDADDGGLALGLVLAEGLDLDGLTLDEDADAVVGDEAVSIALDAVAPADDLILLVSSRQHGLAIGGVQLAPRAHPKAAVLALKMPFDVVVVVAVAIAAAAYEGLVVHLVFVPILAVVV
jgi:hypothetical protein